MLCSLFLLVSGLQMQIAPTSADIANGMERLKGVQREVSGTYEVINTVGGVGKTHESKRKVEFAVRSDCYVFEEYDEDGSVSVFGKNDRYVFCLNRRSQESNWRIRMLVRRSDLSKVSNFDASVEMKFVNLLLDSSYAILTVDLRPVFDDEFDFTNAERLPDGTWSIRISTSEKSQGAQETEVKIDGNVTLDPSQDWSIVGFDGEAEQIVNKVRAKGRVVCENSVIPLNGGFIVNESLVTGVGKRDFSTAVSLLDVNARPIADEVFTLSAYGLPEPEFASGRVTPLLLITLVSSAIVIGIFVYRLISKRRSRDPSTSR